VALGFYWVMWTPMLLVLAALGAAELVRRAARWAVPVAVVVAVAVLAVPAAASARESVAVADLRPTGVAAVPALMRTRGLHGAVASAGLPRWYWSYYLPGTTVHYTAREPLPGTSLVVVGRAQCLQPIDPSLRALVDVNLRTGALRKIHADTQLTAYEAVAPLTMPTDAQIRAEPPANPTNGC
jgi:hypothetical protein